ncbi:MAG: hypothetical protein ACI9Z9_002227 [Litorivivens sp.]|jgi:hypothetical protein
MSINLTSLSYDELVNLHEEVVERLKTLDAIKSLEEMAALNIGARVCFETSKGTKIGRVFKFNIKTVGVVTEDGRKWKVPPYLLTRMKKEDSNVHVIKPGKKRKR